MKNNPKNLTGFEIAIIGMAGVFPQSPSIQDFWNNLTEGKELITFFTPEELEEFGIDENIYKNKKFVNAFGKIEDKDCFDAAFFKYLPAEAEVMDPQSRLFHQVVWTALEDAGIKWDKQSNDIGLYAGAKDNPIWKTYTGYIKNVKALDYYTVNLLNSKDSLATLISYKLGLKGPAISLNTTCSTSLVAVHLACRALLMGECKMAVAGGASLSTNPNPGYLHQEGMIFSSDGHCKTFDQDSDGTIVGEGAGAVVLKRLSEAIKDGDHIYAMIKGSAINNDGLRKIGYTAPSIEGQVDCIKMAHTISKVDPASISYIEAHGTATKLGDPIEVEALNKAFNNKTEKHCLIGSVKSNMGHLDAAAGVSGLIKTVLALQHKKIPASINFKTENPQIPFAKGPFTVVTETQDWTNEGDQPLRAGVSSFGIGGTNAHVVLEEMLATESTASKNEFQVFPFSALNEKSALEYQKNFQQFLKQNDDLSFSDIAYTLQSGRKHFHYRDAIVATDRTELLHQLANRTEAHGKSRFVKQEAAKVVFLFSGQGSQYFKMGWDLYQQDAFFQSEMDKGFDLLKTLTGEDYRPFLYQENGDAEKINNTQYTQPLLFIFEYALAQLMLHRGIKADYLMGHSLGEYVAATMSGVFSYADALNIIVKRGELISSLPEGSMLSISASAEEVQTYLAKDLSIAAINSPTQIVLSGTNDAIQNLATTLEKEDRRFKLLSTSHAFHSAMMDPILEAFENHFKQFELKEPTIPFVSNLSGKMIAEGEATSPAYWAQHLRQAIQFAKGTTALYDIKNAVFIEVGPGNRLIRLLKQNKPKDISLKVASTIRNADKDMNDGRHLMENLALLWQSGVSLDWSAFYENESRKKVALPTYVFQKNRFEATVYPEQMQMGEAPAKPKKKKSKTASAVPTPKKDAYVPKDISNFSTSDIELEVVEVWKDFFGTDDINQDSDFFELGGDSLKAMSLINIIHEKFNAEVSLTHFMEKSTAAELAEELQNINWVNQDKKLANKITI